MKTLADDTGRSDEDAGYLPTRAIDSARFFLSSKTPQDSRKLLDRFFPHAVFSAMICAILVIDAILPLRDLWFHEALLTQMGRWPVLPSLLLFPGWSVIPPIGQTPVISLPNVLSSWGMVAMLLGAFAVAFLVYIFALRSLPARISQRFVMGSTFVIGLLFLFIPVVTSPDLYSYIAYARLGIVHGMNPLTTTPQTISTDVIYRYVTWVDQPSAYGPAWALLTCFFQLIMSLCGQGNHILSMVLVLRAWGLVMHLCSVALVWSLGGLLQRLHGIVSKEKRMHATLAFAWNPLLLLEACTNAHNDATLLFLILLAIWFLVRARSASGTSRRSSWTRISFMPRLALAVRDRLFYLAPAILLALGTCLKINLILLVFGLFFYQWLQETEQPMLRRIRRVGSSVAVYIGLIVALYAPFWQGGAILSVFMVNPAASRTINTLADAFSHLYNSIMLAFGFPVSAPIGSPAEHFLHTLSLGLFVLIYLGLCWQVLCTPTLLRSIHGLVRWMALTWLLYCAVGSPWFWPWYLITFLGLYALIEASKPAYEYLEEGFSALPAKQTGLMRLFQRFQTLLLHRRVVRALTFSMFTLYCFIAWGPQHSLAPFLPGLQWAYLNGFWAWGIPLVALVIVRIFSRSLTYVLSDQQGQKTPHPVPEVSRERN